MIPTGARNNGKRQWGSAPVVEGTFIAPLWNPACPSASTLRIYINYSSCQAAASPISWLFSVAYDCSRHHAAHIECSVQEFRADGAAINTRIMSGSGEKKGKYSWPCGENTLLKISCSVTDGVNNMYSYSSLSNLLRHDTLSY